MDVVPVDSDVLVAVTPALFVVETQCVEQLVLDDTMIYTAIPLQ